MTALAPNETTDSLIFLLGLRAFDFSFDFRSNAIAQQLNRDYMEDDDFSDLFDVPVAKAGGRGGKRENAGRKPKGYVKPPEVVDFEKARARNEAAKANNNELEFLVKSGQYVDRDVVRQAAATIFLNLAQTLRSIPDVLERNGHDAAICQHVETVLNDTLEQASLELELLGGGSTEKEGS